MVAACLDAWLHGTGSGLRVRAVGFDEQSAKRNGVATKWVRTRAMVLSALFAAVASILIVFFNGDIGGNVSLGSLVVDTAAGRAADGTAGRAPGLAAGSGKASPQSVTSGPASPASVRPAAVCAKLRPFNPWARGVEIGRYLP